MTKKKKQKNNIKKIILIIFFLLVIFISIPMILKLINKSKYKIKKQNVEMIIKNATEYTDNQKNKNIGNILDETGLRTPKNNIGKYSYLFSNINGLFGKIYIDNDTFYICKNEIVSKEKYIKDNCNQIKTVNYSNTRSIYSLDSYAFSNESLGVFINSLNKLHVTNLYQVFDESSFKEGSAKMLVSDLKKKNIKVSAIIGNKLWSYDKELSQFKIELQKIIDYNNEQHNDAKITSIVLNVDVNNTNEWKNNPNTAIINYTDTMISMYKYAKEAGFDVIECIPSSLDDIDYDQLNKLIMSSGDSFSVMNYEKKNVVENIKNEVFLAKKYSKPIESIAEVQANNETLGINDTNTFYNNTFKDIERSFATIEKNYNYKYLRYSYHYYKPMYYIINDKKKGMLDLRLFDELGKQPIVKNIKLVSSNGDIVKGYGYISNNQYSYLFYGIKNGVDYQLQSDNYLNISKESFIYNNIENGYHIDSAIIKQK